jgi:ferredoxin
VSEKTVKIYIMGKSYDVPHDSTIMKAMEHAGFKLVRGCGCRGGFCGACATVYRTKDDYRIKTGLACQTVVEEGMYLTQIPFFPANKATYRMDDLEAIGSQLMQLYPEISRCVGCNSCSKICPQDLEVMDYVAAALKGDIAGVADMSFDCIMCGLCAARCPAEIVQYNVAILARRLYGKYIAPRAEHLTRRLGEIESGAFDDEVRALMEMDEVNLQKLYAEREIEPD